MVHVHVHVWGAYVREGVHILVTPDLGSLLHIEIDMYVHA